MKARFKLKPHPELCKDYPNCNCEGHEKRIKEKIKKWQQTKQWLEERQ